MRDGQAPLPSDSAARQGLRQEAAFFGCWPLVEALDAAEERHARTEVGGQAAGRGVRQLGAARRPRRACRSWCWPAPHPTAAAAADSCPPGPPPTTQAAREQAALDKALLYATKANGLREVHAEWEAAEAAAKEARALLASLQPQLDAAQAEARAAREAQRGGGLPPPELERQRRRQHAAERRWHDHSDAFREASRALGEARERKHRAVLLELATLRVTLPSQLGSPARSDASDSPDRPRPDSPIGWASPPAGEWRAWELAAHAGEQQAPQLVASCTAGARRRLQAPTAPPAIPPPCRRLPRVGGAPGARARAGRGCGGGRGGRRR